MTCKPGWKPCVRPWIRNLTNWRSGWFVKAVARALILIGVLRYLHKLCLVGLCGQVGLEWEPPQKEQVWRNRQLEALHPRSLKLLHTILPP